MGTLSPTSPHFTLQTNHPPSTQTTVGTASGCVTKVDQGQSWFGSTEPEVQCPEMSPEMPYVVHKWQQCPRIRHLTRQVLSSLELEQQKAPFNMIGHS